MTLSEYQKVELEMRVWREQQVEINKRIHLGQKWLYDNVGHNIKSITKQIRKQKRRRNRK